jgi:hypothetical protein
LSRFFPFLRTESLSATRIIGWFVDLVQPSTEFETKGFCNSTVSGGHCLQPDMYSISTPALSRRERSSREATCDEIVQHRRADAARFVRCTDYCDRLWVEEVLEISVLIVDPEHRHPETGFSASHLLVYAGT